MISAFLFFLFPPTDPPDVHEAQGGNSRPLSFARSWRPGTWRLAVSKFPAILDRYSRFSDACVFDFSFFSVLIFSMNGWI